MNKTHEVKDGNANMKKEQTEALKIFFALSAAQTKKTSLSDGSHLGQNEINSRIAAAARSIHNNRS